MYFIQKKGHFRFIKTGWTGKWIQGYGIRAGTSKFSCKYEVHHKNQRLCDDTYHGKKDSSSQGTICTGKEGIYAV